MKNHVNKLVECFADYVPKQDVCIARGDSKMGNVHAKKYIYVAKLLLLGGNKSVDTFAFLLKHESDSVKVMTVAFLLELRTGQAVETLKPLAVGKGLAALGAKMTLERYEKGQLKIV